MTADELLTLPQTAGRVELVDGEPRYLPFHSFDHGAALIHIGGLIYEFVEARRLGATCANVGFVLARDPDTVLGADVAFLRTDRVPAEGRAGFVNGPPDLAVEIWSRHDKMEEIPMRSALWLDAGTRLLWNVDLVRKTVAVHSAGDATRMFGKGDSLSGGDVLPGYAIAVNQLFDC